jgi:dihydrofolate reductase
MGDVTFNSIGKVLSDRKTIVLTKDQNFTAEGVEVINNIDSIVNKYKSNPEEDIYICGGAKVYESFLPHVDKMIISLIKGEYEGDTFFPTYNENDFKLTSEVDHEEFIVKELNSL